MDDHPLILTLPHSRTARHTAVATRKAGYPPARSNSAWLGASELDRIQVKGLILAQNERWRRGLGMQVVRERFRKMPSKVAEG